MRMETQYKAPLLLYGFKIRIINQNQERSDLFYIFLVVLNGPVES